jgi:hypothetical protein
MGCVPPDFQRLDFYKLAATADIKLGKIPQAEKWIDRATTSLPELSAWELIGLGELELSCKNSVRAAYFADKAEAVAKYDGITMRNLASLWTRLGNTARAEQVQKEEAIQKQKMDEMTHHAMNGPFRQVGW